MDDEAPGVTYVGEMGPQVDPLHEPHAGLEATREAEREHRAEAAAEVLATELVGLVPIEPRIGHPRDGGVGLGAGAVAVPARARVAAAGARASQR